MERQSVRPYIMLTSPTHLDMHLQAARAEDGGVDHVPPVRQPHDEDVVQGLDAVQLGEELVYHLSAVGVGGGGCCCFCLEGACICWLCHAWDVVVGYFLGGACMCVGYVIHGKGVGGRRLVLLSFFLYKKRVSVGRVKSVSSFFFQSKSVSVLDVGVYKQQ